LHFDLLQEHLERGLVGGVTRQHFVSDGETLRGNDQDNDDLHAVTPLVAAVTKAALVLFILRRRGFEVSACQIIEQDVEVDTEQVLPALGQMME
jgi:hypothetical protein